MTAETSPAGPSILYEGARNVAQLNILVQYLHLALRAMNQRHQRGKAQDTIRWFDIASCKALSAPVSVTRGNSNTGYTLTVCRVWKGRDIY